MSTPEPCTTETGRSNTKRHYSTDLRPAGREPGRVGSAVCSTSRNRVVVRDQEWFTGSSFAWRARMVIDALPECGNCARILHHI